ncbi:MAG: prepilin-type N-terminal cleavage/methylation domain-containing protein [Candidatus Woesebacteria bacterium]|nr:MAG: prepilin-type N-terminal cleavage/methylation domain-containing protein [Candidatus Woesebacteria bacterium]
MERKGATLIEILVGIAVLGIVFSGLGYASFRDFTRRQGVENSYRNLLSDLRFAQKDSSAGRKPAGCIGVLNGYSFGVSSCSSGKCSSYTISALCSGSSPVNVNQVNLSSGITLGSVSTFTFKSLLQGTSLATGQVVNLVLTDPTGAITRTITVSDTGEIK